MAPSRAAAFLRSLVAAALLFATRGDDWTEATLASDIQGERSDDAPWEVLVLNEHMWELDWVAHVLSALSPDETREQARVQIERTIYSATTHRTIETLLDTIHRMARRGD